MAADPKEIVRRYETLLAQQSTTRSLWQEIADYILPRKSNIVTKRSPGQKQTTLLFDSTAIDANAILAASMQGALTNASTKWFRFKTRDKELNEDPEVAVWLNDCTDRTHLAFTQSNLASEFQEVYLDLGAFGIGNVYEEERDAASPIFSGFRFASIPVGCYVIAEDADGLVDTVIREITMSARAAVKKWGAGAVGDRISKMIEKKADEQVTILHSVYPREGAYGRTARRKPIASCFVDKEGKHLISEGGFDYFPFMVPRWAKTSGEVYGRGPGHTALPDVRTLNRARELTLKAWAKAIDPPMKSRQDGVVGTVKLQPASINTVVNMDDLEPIQFGARFDVGTIEEEQLRGQIRAIFFNNQLQLPNKQYMTATEVERSLELMNRFLGPTVGRLVTELLNPLIEQSFARMLTRGAFLPMPQVLQEQVPDIDIEYEGPLARAQRSSDVQAIERTMVIVQPIAQLVPEATDVLDFDETVRYIATRNDLPPQLLRSKDGINAKRQAREEERAALQQQEKIRGMAEMAGKVAPLVKTMGPEALESATGGAPAQPAQR